MSAESDPQVARLYRGDDTWHDGAGWYWFDDEYPEDSGAVGAFHTLKEAECHANMCGYYKIIIMRW